MILVEFCRVAGMLMSGFAALVAFWATLPSEPSDG